MSLCAIFAQYYNSDRQRHRMLAFRTQGLRFGFLSRCAFQPIFANASKGNSSHHQALPLLKRWALPLVGIHATESVRWFHTLRVCIPSNRASCSVAESRRCFSVKKETMSVQIAHPCLDSIFQYGFADPEILKDFLNVVLEFGGAHAIDDITYLPQNLPPENPYEKPSYQFTVDVRCRTKSGRHFLIEMQNDFRSDYHLKALIEHSRMLSRLGIDEIPSDRSKRTANNVNDKKKFWKGVEGLYTIIVSNKGFPSSTFKTHYSGETVAEPFVVNPYELRHVKQLDRHVGDVPIQVVFFMLDKLKLPHPGQVLTPVERWAQVFRDPALKSGVARIPTTKKIKDVEALAGDVKSIRAFIHRLNVTNLPIHVKESYDRSIKYNNGAILDIQEKASQKALKSVAEKMLIDGSSVSQIVKITGLSHQFVESLASQKSACDAD